MNGWAIFGIVIGAVSVIAVIAFIILGFYVYCISIKRNALFGRIIKRNLDKNINNYKINRTWWDSQKQEKLELNNGKENLVGFLIRPEEPSKKIAILVHGYCVTHKDMSAQAEFFLRKEFNVFAPDLRAHGESSGKIIGLGKIDKDDIILWIKKLIKMFGKDSEIVLMGTSMGGATVCMTSGEKLPSNVKCVISDCSYDNAYDEFKHILKEFIKLPEFPLMKIAEIFIKYLGKYDLKDVSPKDSIKRSKIPILFIHGAEDRLVPARMVKTLYENSDKKKCDLYLAEGAKHAMSFAVNSEKYEKIIMNFVNKNIQ